MKIPIFIDGDIALAEVARIFTQAGYHIHSDSAGRLCASRVPGFLRKDPAQAKSNVVHLKARPGIGARWVRS